MSTQLYLIRHAESTHNRFRTDYPERLDEDPFFFDAGLSPLGVEQATKLSKTLDIHPELIVVSPLLRALDTLNIIFSHYEKMPPVIVLPIVSEAIDNACDIGTPTSMLKELHPDFNFEHLEEEIWFYAPDNVTALNYKDEFLAHRWSEDHDIMHQKIDSFKEWIKQRKEKSIAVIGHSMYFKIFLNAEEKLANCEVFPYTLQH
eukprot:TRINITY_DN3739_c0_g2_i1.p1 TRINITY_DN3739_c0_g2~~TRINITY_DN3739_c0_g2_i1.p1  ORF type:complete len:203 (+),score=36.18 TRINITY_DN3739_c0_g2_i1:373-981(+)